MTITVRNDWGPWPTAATVTPRIPTFTAGWPDTLDQLRLEVVALHGEAPGYPDATVTICYPGVIVDTAGLRLMCDTYIDGWRCPASAANLRAIVLTLEAMRLVRRHGVTVTQEVDDWLAPVPHLVALRP